MKKLLTIVVLALILCLGLSVALAAQYTAVYNTPYDGDDDAILYGPNWSVYIEGSEWAVPDSAKVQYDDVYAADHGERSWVTISYTTVTVSGKEVDVEAHGMAVRDVNKHYPDWDTFHYDEECREVVFCDECGCALYWRKGDAARDETVDSVYYVTDINKAGHYHDYAPVLVTDPDCWNYGQYENRCTRCDALEGEGQGTLITHHRAERVWMVDPLCLTDGKGMFYYWCPDCDSYLYYNDDGTAKNAMTDKTARSPQMFVPTTPAMEEQLRTWWMQDTGRKIDDNGHEMDAWTLLYPQSCLHPKTEVRWCVNCMEHFETRETGTTLDPVYVPQDVPCDKIWKDMTFNCVLCDGKAVGHKVTATAEEFMTDEDYAEFADKVNVVHNFLNRNQDKVNASSRAATCTLDGWTAYKCTLEGSHDTTVIKAPAVGDWKGTHYNYNRVFIPALGHEWTDWEMVVAPGEGENVTGFWRRACTRILPAGVYADGTTLLVPTPCGKVDRWFAELPPASDCEEHVPMMYDSIEPTCTEDGVGFMCCEVCGTELDDIVLPATGHTWKTEIIVEATCAAEGVALKTCEVCEKVEKVTLAKKDHTWDEGVVTTEPTTEKAGVKTYTCKVCKETKTEEIAKKDKPAEYKLEDVKYTGNILSGKIKHTEGTLEADKLNIRVTFFLAGNIYMTNTATIYADGTFEAEGAGDIEAITLVAYAAEKVVNPADVADLTKLDAKEIIVK